MSSPRQQVQQQSLRIGDVIFLYSKEGKGYVFSETSSSHHLAVLPVISPDDPNIPDKRMAAFKVLAPNKNKAQQRLADLKKKLGDAGLSADDKMQLLTAEKNVEVELKSNQLEQERRNRTPVLYGSVIQLLHMYSSKYVAISTVQISKTEASNMQMQLSSHDSGNCLFKILPRYKVRSIGDEVHADDQVTFASEETAGQYIHTSSKTYYQVGVTLHEQCREINGAASESGYTIKSHYTTMSDEQEKSPLTLTAGGVVRLFHREIECYLVAEGSFANDKEDVMVEDVHLRKRKSDHGRLKAPSTSSITYWQIEKDKEPLSGQTMHWGERCRIKHLPTRLYLAVMKSKETNTFQVTLKEHNLASGKADFDIVFRLFPVIEEESGIEFMSYARINHPHTKTWLAAKKGDMYCRRAFNPNAPGLASLQWDSAELTSIGVHDQMSYDDAFTIEKVDDKLVKKFAYVAGIVPIMMAYIKEIESGQSKAVTIKKANLVRKALDELSDFMKNAHPTMKDHQKLLRNLMVLEVIVRILKNFNPKAPDANVQRIVGKGCYRVVEVYLLGQSRKNENYLARFIPFFETQVGMDLNAENMLTELVRDNSLIVSKYGENQIDDSIQKLLQSKDPRFFDKLGVLCVCNDRPIPEKQNTIIEKLVRKHGKELFYLTEIGGSSAVPNGDSNTIYFHAPSDPKERWHSLHDIAAKEKSKESKDYQYLVAQLDLFGKLCKGNNVKAVDVIDKEFNYLTFEEALTGAKDDTLHPAVRSKYVELIVVLYVDVGDNRAILENLSFSFIYSKVVEDPYKLAAANPKKSLTGSVNVHFPALRDWIKSHVEKHQSVTGSKKMIDSNNFNAEVLDLLYLLVKYGYYADLDDINVLMPPLISLLNGMNDKPFPNASDEQSTPFRMEGRYKDTHDNRSIFNMKIKALKVLDLFFNFRFYLRLQHFIYDYKQLKGDVDPDQEVIEDEDEQDEEQDQPVKHHRGLSRYIAPPAQLQQITSGITQQVSQVTHQVTNVTHRFTTKFTGGPGQRPPPPAELQEFQRSSRRLRIHENTWLMNLATDRLKTVFAYSAYEFENVTDGRGVSFSTILIDLSKYKNDELLHEALHLLNRFYSAEENLFEKAVQAQLLITDSSEKVFNEVSFTHLPTLRHLAEVDVNDTQYQQLIGILDRLTTLCHLEGDPDEPHTQNQKILYNTGVFTDVVNLVFRDDSAEVSSDLSEEKDSAKKQQHEFIVSKCLQFLKNLSRKNSLIQKRLFDRMNDFLELDVAIPDMAEVLTEVFTGNQETCLKIKEQQVEKVFKMITCGGPVGQAELLGLLKAVAKVEELDLPLKRNQAYIIKYFSIMRDVFCGDLVGLEEEKEKRRKELILNGDNSDPSLQVLLKTIDLLASCAEGENLFIESVCQNIMSVNELLQILTIDDLDPRRKRPFLRYLLWVYMNVGGDKIHTGSIILHHDWQMWTYLEHISLLLEGITKALQNLPPDQLFEAKHNLTTQSIRYKHGRKTKTVTAAYNIPFVTDGKGEIAPGVLLYIMEGILPMLKVFYTDYFIPHDKTATNIAGYSGNEVAPEKEIQISASIARGLLYLVDVIISYLSSQDQWELLRTTILTILHHDCYEEGLLNVDSRVWARFNLRVKHNVTAQSESLDKFKEEYAREIKLNDEFNNFVRNFELAYWGPNTARHQIHSPYDIDYSEFEDDLLEVRGDEWLPLGPSFQQHICLYTIRGQHSTKIVPVTERIIDCLVSSFNNLGDLDEKERYRQDRSDIRYIQLLRAIIHNEIMFVDPDLREEGQDPVLFRKQSERLRSVQNQIQSFGNVVKRLVSLLSHPNELISAEVLAFLTVILYTGNREIQNGFSYLLETREEKLFVNMQYRLQQASTNDRERRMLLSQLESRIEAEKALKAGFGASGMLSTAIQATSNENLLSLDAASAANCDITHEPAIYNPETKLLSTGNVEMEMADDGSQISMGQMETTFSTAKYKRPKPTNEEELIAGIALAENKIQLQKLQAHVKSPLESSSKASSLKFKDSSYIELALRALGLLCDGQYRPMQNYLREQPDNIKTINLLSEVCMFLQSFYVEATKDNIALIKEILQTLIEMSVGNFINQQVLFDHQIVDTINRILQTVVFQRCSLSDVLELKQSAVELLQTMCEETHPDTEKLVQGIFKSIDIDALQSTLVYFYKLSQDQTMKDLDKNDDAERAAFKVYHVLIHFADFEGISMSDVEPQPSGSKDPIEAKCDEDLEDAWDYCQKYTKSIELLYENDDNQKTLAKVHFRFDPKDELPEEIIEKVKYRVSRDSPEDKLRDFLDWMISVRKEIIHLTRLRSHWYTNMFVYNLRWRNYLLILWTLIMNILLIIAWSNVDMKLTYNDEDQSNDTLNSYCRSVSCYGNDVGNSPFSPDDCNSGLCMTADPTVPLGRNSHWFFDYALYIGGGIHLLMSIAMVMSYFLINGSNFVMPDAFYKYILRNERTTTYSDEPFFGLRSLYHIVFVACSALSLPFYGYFYCVCLLHIVIDNDILQRVLRSVTKNGRSLLWVAALGLVVMYIYSVGTFAFLANEFHEPDPEEPGDNVRFCRSLIQCFISVLEYGLLDTLGLTVDLPTKFRETALRVVFFDLTFFIIVTTIGLNIVFGIIVDTFSELRDERWHIEEDKKGSCFICNIASYEFERRSEGFDHHVKHEHSMWNYIYFYLYLERIDVSNHNALESYAYHQIKNEKTNLFPLFHARSLKASEDDTSTQLAELREMVAEIMQHFRKEEKNAALHRKREEQAQWEREQRKDT